MAFSILLGLILAALMVVNFLLVASNRWTIVFSIIFALLLLVPSDATGLISGHLYNAPGKFNISLVGYDVIIVWLCVFLCGKFRVKEKNRLAFFTVLFSVLFIFVVRLLIDGWDALSNKMFDNYLLPALLAILLISYLSFKDVKKVLSTILLCIMINAVILCLEFFVSKSMFFHQYYLAEVEWYLEIYNIVYWGGRFRGTALLGHPLVNGIYYLMGIVYLYHLNSKKYSFLRMICLAILYIGLLIVNSRGALLAAILYTAYYLVKNKRYGKIALMGIAGIICLLFVDVSKIYYALFARDASGKSMMHRFTAIMAFFEIPFETIFFGTGYNNTSEALMKVGLTGNFENAYLIVLLENGILGFMAWVSSLIVLFKSKGYHKKNYLYYSMVRDMSLAFLILSFVGNYFGDPGTLNYFLWTIFGLSHFISSLSPIEMEVCS